MILLHYVFWHYTTAPLNIVQIGQNYLAATWHLFFIPQHLKTLFAPWHRVRPRDFSRNPSFSERVGDVVVDIFMRIVAACVRIGVVLIGFVAFVLVAALGVVMFVAWIAWPFLAVFLVVFSIDLLVS